MNWNLGRLPIAGAVVVLVVPDWSRLLAPEPPPAPDMNALADRYVTLVLQVGQHDPDFVDAYYGDPAKKPTGAPVPLGQLAARPRRLHAELVPSRVDPRPTSSAACAASTSTSS